MFNRVEALKYELEHGNREFALLLIDFHLVKGTITQEDYDSLLPSEVVE